MPNIQSEGLQFVGTPIYQAQPLKPNQPEAHGEAQQEASSAANQAADQSEVSAQGSADHHISLVDEPSARETRPTTISVGVGIPSGMGFTVNHNINDKFSLGGGIGTSEIMNDYSVHSRYYAIRGKNWAGYTESSVHLMQNKFPELGGDKFGGAFAQTVGVEYRGDNGFTVNLDGGVALSKYGAMPAGKLTFGYSF